MKLGSVGSWVRWSLCLASLGACGGKPDPAPQAAQSSGEERRPEEPDDQMGVSGLRGTLSEHEIQGALDPRMPKFARCVQQRAATVEWLSGALSFEFHLGLDGKVMNVYPRESTMGDRATERCAAEVAAATRFPAPHGGEADFAWSFEVPLDSAIREPVSLPLAQLEPEPGSVQSAIDAGCGTGRFVVTAYVDETGRVVAAGAAAGDPESAQKLDCVASALESLVLKSPGSYAAKVQFSVP